MRVNHVYYSRYNNVGLPLDKNIPKNYSILSHLLVTARKV